MNRIRAHITGLFLLLLALSVWQPVRAQKPDSTSLNHCDQLLGDQYISDGQNYVASLNRKNTARFHAIFYGGNRYRLVACSNIEDYPLILRVYDSERNLLFANTRHNYSPDWHLVFNSTVTCVIEISVDAESHIDKLVKLLIGFKRNPFIQQTTDQ